MHGVLCITFSVFFFQFRDGRVNSPSIALRNSSTSFSSATSGFSSLLFSAVALFVALFSAPVAALAFAFCLAASPGCRVFKVQLTGDYVQISSRH